MSKRSSSTSLQGPCIAVIVHLVRLRRCFPRASYTKPFRHGSKGRYTTAMHRSLGLSSAMILIGFLPFFASAATLALDPAVGTYGPGDTFIVNVRLDTDDSQCINAAHVVIQYPTASLRAVDFGRGNSIFSLWVGEPKIDTTGGTIDFSGGVPGGYCGRIPGDPALSNILGGIVFTVVGSSTKSAAIQFSSASTLYKNDGLGTSVVPTFQNAAFKISPTPVSSSNPWIAEVSADTIPPEPFPISLESTRGVFDGKYYIVFSTVDKQSGLDHYEVYENKAWIPATSPHVLADQSLKSPIQVRALDKAGNIRMGTYNQGKPPPRQYSFGDLMLALAVLIVFIVVVGTAMYLHRRMHRSDVVDLRT